MKPPRLRHRLEYGALRAVTAVLRLMPLDVARRVGAFIGRLGYRPLGIRRTTVERQLAAAFPGLAPPAVATMARAAYAHLGRLAIELALLPHLKQEGLRALFEEDSDLGLVQRLAAGGRGIVLCTGHVGNWELTGAYLAMHGLPLDAVVRRMANPLFDGFLNRTRSRVGMRVIYDSDAVRQITRGLKEGRHAALVADQGVLGLASSFVTFFGRPAKTPRGPAVFALKFDAPVVFCAAVLQPSGRYRFMAEEVPVVKTGDREADVDATVQRFTSALERLVRRYPEQYFWHHRRWKRQPPDTPPELRDPAG
ncbi:MAG: lysophospholipid acyltransferase family protein [Gemmatimonadetes bacterium]|nr:lysophospholipid acyltransferase family protein [Gemmatimonadota bacterium]